MKVCPVGDELFHADGQTDMTKQIFAFRISEKRAKNSRDSLIGIVTKKPAAKSGVLNPGSGNELLSPLNRPYGLWDPPNLLPMGATFIFPGVNQSRREADHSPPSTVDLSGPISPLILIKLHVLFTYTIHISKARERFRDKK